MGNQPCKLWRGKLHAKGYGLVPCKLGGKWVWRLAHRVEWEKANGPIPDGMKICHTCDNPPCHELEHLFLGTQADNMADKVAKGRQSKGETSHLSVLTEAEVVEIRELRARGRTQQSLADEYGVDRATVGLVVTGQNWKHVGGPITVGRVLKRGQ